MNQSALAPALLEEFLSDHHASVLTALELIEVIQEGVQNDHRAYQLSEALAIVIKRMGWLNDHLAERLHPEQRSDRSDALDWMAPALNAHNHSPTGDAHATN